MKNFEKAFQIVAGTISCFALCLQFYLIIYSAPEFGLDYLQATIKYFSFMTILTNILVALTYVIPLFKPNSKAGLFFSNPVIQSGVLVYILIVFLVYHFILSHQWNPQGWEKIADCLLHYVVPFLYLLFWLFFVVKGLQGFMNSIKWLIYPFAYVVYALIRGEISGLYPYFFLNISKLGFGKVLINIFYVTIAYIAVGIIVVVFDKLLSKYSIRQS